MFMADLFLHESRIPAVLDQVRDIRPSQRMEIETTVQAQRLPAGRAKQGANEARLLCGLLPATDIGAPNERALRNDCTSAGLRM